MCVLLKAHYFCAVNFQMNTPSVFQPFYCLHRENFNALWLLHLQISL